MADSRDNAAVVIDTSNQIEHFRISTQLVGSKTAGHDDPIKIGGTDITGRRLGLDRIAMLALIYPGLRTYDAYLSTSL